jgi:hypothetical protein
MRDPAEAVEKRECRGEVKEEIRGCGIQKNKAEEVSD